MYDNIIVEDFKGEYYKFSKIPNPPESNLECCKFSSIVNEWRISSEAEFSYNCQLVLLVNIISEENGIYELALKNSNLNTIKKVIANGNLKAVAMEDTDNANNQYSVTPTTYSDSIASLKITPLYKGNKKPSFMTTYRILFAPVYCHFPKIDYFTMLKYSTSLVRLSKFGIVYNINMDYVKHMIDVLTTNKKYETPSSVPTLVDFKEYICRFFSIAF